MTGRASEESGGGFRWYLLIHQLPPEPLYLRAKIRQRLARVGAVALKKSVYVLPRREECLEDLQWIAEEAVSGGGEAYVCEATFTDEATARMLVRRFREQRDLEYGEISGELRSLLSITRRKRRPADADATTRLADVRRRIEEVRRIDYFDADGRRSVDALLTSLEGRLAGAATARQGPREDLVGRTWVTRRGVQIDRIVSAWFVRRFIDPGARFRFADAPADRKRADEICFDAPGGDFTHEGDRCTFETLVHGTGAADPSLTAIAEIVHDVDIKDGKFGRPEAPGIERVLHGIVASCPEDSARLERGAALFDELYESFREGKTSFFTEVPK